MAEPPKKELQLARAATEPARIGPAESKPGSRVDTLPDAFASLLHAHKFEIGDIVGERYRVERVLGAGAMGDVFVAENVAIGTHVAIKVLKRELLADPVFRQRFQQEAQAVATIDHPNVARFLDLIVGDPTFLVMEHVAGATLDALIRAEGRLEPRRAVAIAERLCWALDAAHAAGVIHRDLKPANVIVSPDREHGETPKLIDFGLAKLAAVTAGEKLTRAGQIVGTPHYMSPEQISRGDVTARSDVYALGCVLYEMLVGKAPFVGADDDVQVLYQQLHDLPDPPSKHAPVPPALDEVVLQALAKDPDARFASMRDMAAALVRSVEKRRRPPAAPPAARTRRWMAPSLAALALAALVTVFLLRRAPAPAVAAGGAFLIVTSTPAGATVHIDGKPAADPTPLAVSLPAGAHELRIARADHAPVTRRVSLVEKERATVDFTLPAITRSIEVRTTPSGATLFVDDVMIRGQTPAAIAIEADDFHMLRVEKDGYEVATRRINPEDHDAAVTVAMEPEKRPRGTVSVDSRLQAEVWMDGQNTGHITPTVSFQVPAGTHSFEVRDSSGGRGAAVKVQVKAGEVLHLMLGPDAGERRHK